MVPVKRRRVLVAKVAVLTGDVTQLRLSVAFDQELVDVIVGTGVELRWDPKRDVWELPTGWGEELVAVLERMGYRWGLEEEFTERLEVGLPGLWVRRLYRALPKHLLEPVRSALVAVLDPGAGGDADLLQEFLVAWAGLASPEEGSFPA